MPEQGTSFGTRLRSLRQTAGLTQEELASRAGLSPNAVSSLERGTRRRPQPHTVRSLADALNLSEDERASLIAVVPRQEPKRGATVPEIPTPGSGETLPSHPTPLLGREQELADIRELLLGSSRVRLLTLTGIGGVGKTRLAMEAARASLAEDHFTDGVAFVGLASLKEPALVIPTVARSLGLTEDHGQSASDALRAHLLKKRLLLVIDNFEHLLDAASKVINLIEACPHLVVLATSRAPLRVRGEHEYSVPPLSLPSSTRNPTEKEVLRTSSGRLFVERAQAVSPSFALTTGNAGAVAAICWRLAGLPLALELAAAKVRFLDPAALLSRLDRALSTAWARDLPERQRTMRATLDWSYDLLSKPEQALFRRLSVFVGGFSLEAAEATGEPEEMLDLLGTLIEQSLVQKGSRKVGGEASYGMLEPVRQYARERLESDGEVEETSHRHAMFFLGLTERASSRIWGPEQGEWFDTLEEENGNLRAAMRWALEQDQADIAGRFCWALWLFWWARGHHREGRRLSEAALGGRLSPGLRTRVLPVAASMVYVQGEYDSAEKYWLEGTLLSRQVGDVIGEGYSTAGTGLAQMVRGDFETAAASMHGALPLLKSPEGEDALASLVHVWLGTTQLVQGDMAGAEREIEAGLSSARNREDPLCTYVALYNLAQLALAREDLTLASSALREGIELSGQTKDQANLAHFLEALSAVAALGGALESSTILLGAAEISLQEVGVPVYNFYNPDPSLRERAVEATRARLGEKSLKGASERGRSMSFEEAVGYALKFDLFHNDSAS